MEGGQHVSVSMGVLCMVNKLLSAGFVFHIEKNCKVGFLMSLYTVDL